MVAHRFPRPYPLPEGEGANEKVSFYFDKVGQLISRNFLKIIKVYILSLGRDDFLKSPLPLGEG